MIDAGALLAILVLIAVGRSRRWTWTVLGIVLLLAAVVFIIFGSTVLASFSSSFRTWLVARGAFVFNAHLSLWRRWLPGGGSGPAPTVPWRLAAAAGIVVIALATILDTAWHQSNPAIYEVTMNMLALPGHQLHWRALS